MSKKPLIREALQALKPSEPLKFRAPEKNNEQIKLRSKKAEMVLSSDQNNLSAEESHFDLKSFTPKGKEVEFVEGGGEFHIPHRIFEFIHKALSTKVEILVFSCLLRNTLGYRRHNCQISQTYIAKWAGIAAPNARRALRELEDSGLVILKLRGGVSHECAIYEIPLVKSFLKKKTDKNMISDLNNLSLKNTENRDQNKLGSQINLISNKEREKKEEKNTLSPELKKYFDTCAPAEKQKRELGAFQKLSEEFSTEDIAISLSWLETNGIPNSGDPCHSPMGFLTQAMSQILVLAKKEVEKKEKQKRVETERVRAETEKLAEEAQEAKRFEQAKGAFNGAFINSEARNQFLTQEVQKRRAIIPLPHEVVVRLVIMDWFQRR